MPYLRPGMRLIDAGRGQGSITLGLAEAIAPGGGKPEGEAIGVDTNGGAIEVARSSAAGCCSKNVRFELADVCALPFEDASFDAAFSNGVLQHFANPLRALQEFRRVIKLGALAAQPFARSIYGGHGSAAGVHRGWSGPTALGGDPTVGKRLRELIREAGFSRSVGSATVSCDGTNESTLLACELEAHYLEAEPLIVHSIALGVTSRAELVAMAEAWRSWGRHFGAFRAKFSCEVVAWID